MLCETSPWYLYKGSRAILLSKADVRRCIGSATVCNCFKVSRINTGGSSGLHHSVASSFTFNLLLQCWLNMNYFVSIKIIFILKLPWPKLKKHFMAFEKLPVGIYFCRSKLTDILVLLFLHQLALAVIIGTVSADVGIIQPFPPQPVYQQQQLYTTEPIPIIRQEHVQNPDGSYKWRFVAENMESIFIFW